MDQTTILVFALGQLILCFMCYQKGRYDNTKQIVTAYMSGIKVGIEQTANYYHQQLQQQLDKVTSKENTGDDSKVS